MDDDNRRTTPRPQLARDPKFGEISPDVGEIDDDALADLVEEDPDHAMALLAQMRGATDRQLAAMAARIAGRLVLDVAKAGPVQARGVGTMASSPADRVQGDLDLDRSLEGLVHARATGELVDAADLKVRHWTQPATALSLVIDRSGSMSGKRLATAAVAAAACAHRAPVDWSVLAFADRVIAVKSQDDARSSLGVVDDLLRLRDGPLLPGGPYLLDEGRGSPGTEVILDHRVVNVLQEGLVDPAAGRQDGLQAADDLLPRLAESLLEAVKQSHGSFHSCRVVDRTRGPSRRGRPRAPTPPGAAPA